MGGTGKLSIEGLRDYAVVMLDGRIVAHLDRRLHQSDVDVSVTAESATLDILVENCGRINYGPRFSGERKGVTGMVRMNGDIVRGWRMYLLPFESLDVHHWSDAPSHAPAMYRGAFHIDEPADAFLDTGDLSKGVVWVNGHNAGRFWHIGPQRSLYIPGVWLRAGRNDVQALELFARTSFPRFGSGR
jgi:beta-galactosidase